MVARHLIPAGRVRRLAVLPAAALLLAGSIGPVAGAPGSKGGGGGAGGSGPTFTTFSLAATPPQAVGTTCPGATPAAEARCTNNASEPMIRAGLDGTFWAASENGVTSGTIAWKSTDGGRHYASLAGPNDASQTQDSGFAPGGGDTDVAVATARNPSGNFNVYVASLTLANISVSTSTDNGASWALNPVSASVPGDDREWIAADGASKVCLSYHDIYANYWVNCSADAGATFGTPASAFDADHLWMGDNNSSGNLAIDPASHAIYQTFSGPSNVLDTTGCGGFACLNTVYMAVSTDGGQSFTDRVVYVNPDKTVAYGAQFTQVSVDAAGNVYSVFSDHHNVYYAWSADHGVHWTAPRQVNKAPSATAIMPWSVAGAAGKVDIVWYGTSYYDGVNPPDSYPATAAWYVYFAQSLNATSSKASFSQAAATPIIHYGGVCLSGIACTGNRDLYDDFGVAVNPLTGLASIVYSDDQYRSDALNVSAASCSPANTNTSSCDHTAISTQLTGKGIN
ncbi:MAG TPA: sialidase family protein [Candidatus Acidoferrales bacterium]|nr:sialidase family protein [Candidatus Acidoferrales bacterium]